MLRPSRRSSIDVILFFFQAEDGIRDLTVTGVQTCALPIFDCLDRSVLGVGSRDEPRSESAEPLVMMRLHRHAIAQKLADPGTRLDLDVVFGEIGRASCRERV